MPPHSPWPIDRFELQPDEITLEPKYVAKLVFRSPLGPKAAHMVGNA